MNEGLAALHDDLQDLLGQTVAGRYRVGALIGVGGMAAVFKTEHLGLGREMAFKVLHPHLTNNPEISARFDREAKSASRLDHPNCVQVTDYGSTDHGMKFMVMQLLEGGELTQFLGSALEPLRAVDLSLQILRGLDHAHRQGVVHRDIKPENVFVTRDHYDREVLKLVDFGIAKIVDSTIEDKHKTTAGMVFGTPAYMSPEQAMGVEADARADLYSTGVLLYQMLSGRLPLDNEDPVALVRMQVSADPEPLPASVPPVLAATVERLLEKDRDKRFQTASEAVQVLEALRTMLGGTAVEGSVPAANTSGPIYVDSSRQIIVDPTGQILVDASGQLAAVDPSRPLPVGQARPWEVWRNRTQSVRDYVLRQVGDRPRWQVFAAAGAACAVLLLLVIWVASGPAEPAEGDAVAVADGDDDVAAAGPNPGKSGVSAGAGDVDPEQLAEIDQLLLGNKFDEADALLSPLRDKFPENGALAWRQGKVLGQRKKKEAQALDAYGDALKFDPSLLDNKQFYAELHKLMRNRKVREEALDLALQHMGEHGHLFLLEEVNDERRPLGYNDRKRAMEELKQDEKNFPLINKKLNLALDILQAKDSLTPCTSYGNALDAIEAAPEHYFYTRVEHAEVPLAPAAEEKKTTQEDAATCDGLPQRREQAMVLLAALAPAEDEDVVEIEDDPPADPPAPADPAPTPAKKKKKKKAAKPKKDCEGIRGLRAECWKKDR